MTAMVATVLIHSVVTVSVMAEKPKQIVLKIAVQVTLVQTVNLIGLLTALNAVIPHGMSLALIALH